jgi:hypothetical protein
MNHNLIIKWMNNTSEEKKSLSSATFNSESLDKLKPTVALPFDRFGQIKLESDL